jgi:poly-gamma-glutamate capsule biosynthesis protein CapA/YwtB (metallophosphatase superfamily)
MVDVFNHFGTRGRRILMSGADGFDLVFAGDLVLDEPPADHWLAGIAPAVRRAGVAIGHLEVPHTRQPSVLRSDVPAPGADPAHVAAIARAGFRAVSLAGNHIADCGAAGIADTIEALDAAGISHAGAGATLDAARAPCVVECGDRRVALLSYNCVGPEESWASGTRAGCAYVRVATRDGSRIAPAAPLERADDESLAALAADVRRARAGGALVVVALHKGIVHTPARLAPYERAVAHAAVDAGADVVVGHHAHIVRGIEFHRGKPIFHGLGNGCVVTRALSPDGGDAARAAWAIRRQQLFGFTPDAAYALAPFHPQAVHSMLGAVRVHDDGGMQAGFIPVYVDAPGRPRIADVREAPVIVRYIEGITRDAGLPSITTRIEAGCAWIQ